MEQMGSVDEQDELASMTMRLVFNQPTNENHADSPGDKVAE